MISSRINILKNVALIALLSLFITPQALLSKATKKIIPPADSFNIVDENAFNLDAKKSSSNKENTNTKKQKTPPASQATKKTEQTIDQTGQAVPQQIPTPPLTGTPKIIKEIIVSGNKLVDTDAILDRIPYKIGETFDARKSRSLIRKLFYELKRFKDIQLKGELVGADGIKLHVVVLEKNILRDIKYEPKKRKISDEELKKKINISDIPALDEHELKRFEKEIRNIYRDKSYHNAKVESLLEIDEDGRATAIFKIDEGQKSRVKQVLFKGNTHISGKELRKLLFTKEDWILGFLDNAGNLQPDRLEADKHLIEQYYQSNGFMKAKVLDVDIIMEKSTKHFTIVFKIEEGDSYKIKEVKAPGKGIFKDEYLASRVPIRPGHLYSRKKIMDAMKALEFIWGELGYIYAHIEPSIQPDDDNKEVSIAFYTEPGERIVLNKVNIIGNRKTKDKVIRRKIILREGDLLTNQRMDMSKFNVESLGFFDKRDGVNWKTTRIDENHADLDLIVKEAKTGHAGIKVGFGGSTENLSDPGSGFSVSGELNDTNIFGTGVAVNLNATLSKNEQNVIFNITDPWLFDRPITGALDIYHKRSTYGEFHNVHPVSEKLTGGGITLGKVSPWLNNTQILCQFGGDRVLYERPPSIIFLPPDFREFRREYQRILNCLFEAGSYFWLEATFAQDRKNHPMHPSRGYKWFFLTKFGLPSFDCNVGYFKSEFDINWYTPLIGENDLVLRLHAYFGFVSQFKNRAIPYRELFHIGGPASVRGFLFGQVGPNFCGDSLGGKKAFFVNAELHFPITPDFNIKGVAFYDGGTGFDNPFARCPIAIQNNSFNFRHAVGFGIRMLTPAPIRVDWGFKLDRRKRLSETASEVHFGMTYDW